MFLFTTRLFGLIRQLAFLLLVPAAAQAQAPRVARARGLPVDRVRALVAARSEASFLGEAHVNVLALNRALDGLAGGGRPR